MKQYLNTYRDKIVVVAGGTSGMGEQLALQLKPVAKAIIIMGRSETAGARLIELLRPVGTFRKVEMKDHQQVSEILNQVSQLHGDIDYFFNFAGTFLAGEIRDTTVDDWHTIYDNNILPITHGTAAIYDIMRRQGNGHIINVASAAGLFPVPVMNIYGSTKSAVVSMTLGLRMEAKSFGIDVSVVCPTIVKTPLYDTALYDGVDKAKALDLLKKKLKVQTPETAAERILQRVTRNKAIIHTSISTKLGWALYRISPALYLRVASRVFTSYRESLRQS